MAPFREISDRMGMIAGILDSRRSTEGIRALQVAVQPSSIHSTPGSTLLTTLRTVKRTLTTAMGSPKTVDTRWIATWRMGTMIRGVALWALHPEGAEVWGSVEGTAEIWG
mmetsp:Transcript_8685/g.17617  ORF Transcript_8685/g.17617 Transcript_8685/m.17617 type:complete len:110 (-) Transcript_8685:742-1071(-)